MSDQKNYTPSEEHMKLAYVAYVAEESPHWLAVSEEEARARWDRFIEQVKRDAAREALDGLAADHEHRAGRIDSQGRRNRRLSAADDARLYSARHYPTEETP